MRHLYICLLVVCVSLACLPLRSVGAERLPLLVIAHPTLKVSAVHVSELRAIFLRQSEQLGGERVIAVTYPAGSPLRVDFDARVLGMNEDEVGRFWVDSRIRGTGSPPRSVATPSLVLRMVAALPGAIGYVPKTMVQGAQVKVLRVDGLARGL